MNFSSIVSRCVANNTTQAENLIIRISNLGVSFSEFIVVINNIPVKFMFQELVYASKLRSSLFIHLRHFQFSILSLSGNEEQAQAGNYLCS